MFEHYLGIINFNDGGEEVVVEAHMKVDLEGKLLGGVYSDEDEEYPFMKISGNQTYMNSKTKLSFTIKPRDNKEFHPMDYKVTKATIDTDFSGTYEGHISPSPEFSEPSELDLNEGPEYDFIPDFQEIPVIIYLYRIIERKDIH